MDHLIYPVYFFEKILYQAVCHSTLREMFQESLDFGHDWGWNRFVEITLLAVSMKKIELEKDWRFFGQCVKTGTSSSSHAGRQKLDTDFLH